MVSDFEKAVLVVDAKHVCHRLFDDRLDRLGTIAAAEFSNHRLVEGQLGMEIALEDLGGRVGVGTFDLDLHVESARAQNCRVNQVLSVRGTDDDDVA